MSRPFKVTDEILKIIVELYISGETIPNIAIKLHLSKSTISLALKRAKMIVSSHNEIKIRSQTKKILANTDTIYNIFNLYRDGYSGHKIAELLNITSWSVYSILKKTDNMEDIAKYYESYILNEDIFENIDSHQKAYWLGFIAADGSVSDRCLTIQLSINDIEHLELFKKFIDTNCPIKSGESFNKNKTKKYKFCRIDIYSKKIISDLNKYGIVRNKTFCLRLPQIDDNFMSSYLLGFIDGDGSFIINKNNQLKFSLIGYIPNIKEIQDILIKECSLNKTKIFVRNNHIGYFDYCGNLQVKKIHDYLHKHDVVCLNRKKIENLRKVSYEYSI